jgi:uncharacterized protein YndB with AHSA1/START domain
MKDKLTYEAFYPHPPERVWQALTDAKALGLWLMPTDLKPQVGFRFQFADGELKVTGEVLAVDEGKTLAYTWEEGESGTPSVVTWSLTPKDGGTELRLEHQVLEPEEPYVLIEACPNWRFALHASLPVALALLRAYAARPPVPIVYGPDEPEAKPKLERAGFRQEEVTACR